MGQEGAEEVGGVMPETREQRQRRAARKFGQRVFIAETRHDLLGDDLQACYDATTEENIAALRQRVQEVEVLKAETEVRDA